MLLGLGVTTVSAQRVTPGVGHPATDLRITYSEPRGGFGPEHYSLRCQPASGTLPHPGAACAAIAEEPQLALAGPGQDHSCPAGVPGIRVRGDYRGQSVDVGFSACTSRPGNLLERWLALLPATLQHQEHVRPDRGFGLFSLGERRTIVSGLLLHPWEQLGGLSVYRPELVERVSRGPIPTFLGVGYNRAGRAVSLLSDWDRLGLYGRPISLQTPVDQTELVRRLKGWSHVRCGGVSGLTDRPPSRHVARTVVWMHGKEATLGISAAGVAICSPAVHSLIAQPGG